MERFRKCKSLSVALLLLAFPCAVPCRLSQVKCKDHHSHLPFQQSLLRLPIPKFEDSLTRYLVDVDPLVAPPQFLETPRVVRDFQHGVGHELHHALVARDAANPHTSYVKQWWLEMYLIYRQPLPINYNPQIMLKRDPVPAKNALNQRATSLIASTLRFYRTLRDKHLEPDLLHNKPTLSKTKAFPYFCNLLP
ncbi:hypothetical protein PsorP6_003117 [Peronosclerospora sorghi]|uniref:Uncharacterized protein n=1 Tax=Peronosclerospora sorghi TaxID=230839 RepID=A0ACC0VN47_9STRA|nr:hypothetical protein PsorP6_003117 [Peronosclerospora sorghi]